MRDFQPSDFFEARAFGDTPGLMVVVDTEEAFDWGKPFSRSAIDVAHIPHQDQAQKIFARYGLKPTYVVDYPVATQEPGYRPLREWMQDGHCQIGAHLHPWVNPPFDETVSARNSYPGNLPERLEREKLRRLTEAIEANFASRPTIYKAGRYGIGPRTASILEDLGYEIDVSVVPRTDFRRADGPDFSGYDIDPFWVDATGRLFEVPLTVGWYGRLRRHGERLQPILMSECGMRLHLPGVCARLGLFERIRLSPEGANFAELKRLTDVLLAAGHRLFHLTYHSPSLAPGNTPYVRDGAALRQFLGILERYCDYFFGECDGVPTAPDALRRQALAAKAAREPGDAARETELAQPLGDGR